jgi:hypothetical protein
VGKEIMKQIKPNNQPKGIDYLGYVRKKVEKIRKEMEELVPDFWDKHRLTFGPIKGGTKINKNVYAQAKALGISGGSLSNSLRKPTGVRMEAALAIAQGTGSELLLWGKGGDVNKRREVINAWWEATRNGVSTTSSCSGGHCSFGEPVLAAEAEGTDESDGQD